MRIAFMGTPEFAVPSLEKLVEAGYRPVVVVTGPDRPRGRGQRVTPTPVKEAAIRYGIERILQPESVKAPDFAAALAAMDLDLAVVVAFRILPPEVFTLPRFGSFNLHASLLPRYRGAAPINRAIMAGEKETGVTSFFLQQTVDTGQMLLQRSIPIGPDETAGELHDRLMVLGAEVVVNTVRAIEAGEARPVAQDESLASPAPKIFKEDCRIPWPAPAQQVHDHIRGLSPYPGAWTLHAATLLKCYRARIVDGDGDPGEVLEAGDRLVVACGAGAIELLELQQEGRRRVSGADFLRGFSVRQGDRLD